MPTHHCKSEEAWHVKSAIYKKMFVQHDNLNKNNVKKDSADF